MLSTSGREQHSHTADNKAEADCLALQVHLACVRLSHMALPWFKGAPH